MLRRKGGWKFTGYYNSVDSTTTRYSYVKGLQWNCDPKYPDLFICSITNIVVVGFHRSVSGMPVVTRLDIADPTQFYTPGKADVKKLPTDHPWCTELRSARLKSNKAIVFSLLKPLNLQMTKICVCEVALILFNYIQLLPGHDINLCRRSVQTKKHRTIDNFATWDYPIASRHKIPLLTYSLPLDHYIHQNFVREIYLRHGQRMKYRVAVVVLNQLAWLPCHVEERNSTAEGSRDLLKCQLQFF